MLRTFDIIMIAAMLVAATVTYTIKYEAEKQIAVIAKLKRQIDSEKDTITLLRADWALMTQPGRLQSLVGVYETELNLQPIEPEQLVMSVDEIPERPVDDIQKIISGSDELVASGVLERDAITTGSVKKSGARH
ncbi:hypothetical protein BR10RB9215_C11091 [Brucella sp. 10RB9215]|uniref:cell division protein FtsL n=1 Tax=unclassified Brucella TaxID=2632610 RepID=UPI00090CB672|nr:MULTISPECIES: hypothetical protein [unclassified Brucella]MRN45593.1 hypothetical protein [Brucella sp. 10RB9212]MRN51306.1 hypothetical protein [Brucella sp. 10RB9214]MRN66057.1 hypothetical protein [Brucella sp. 10RB9213]APY14481.1 hypothetical protein BKD02_09625 [Brucella sp. 09RB8910]UWF58313.1 hypothetical protein NYO66_06915 [Brucella sp. 2716]